MNENLLFARSMVLLVGLTFSGVEDLRNREVHSLPVLLMGVVGALLSFLGGDWKDWTVVLRFCPGTFALLFAWVTGECIGYGDAWVLLGLGCFLSLAEIVNLCMVAVTLAGLVAAFLLLVKQRGRKTQIPFVPFLLLGYMVLLLLQIET